MVNRTCDLSDCDRPHLARGLCPTHYSLWHREQHGRTMFNRTCATCGAEWMTTRHDARFGTPQCKGVHLALIRTKTCKLPSDHPARQAIRNMAAADRAAKRAARQTPPDFSWRTARDCHGCGSIFTPLYKSAASQMVCCSARCKRKVAKRRRRAAEHGARGSWTWSEFMHIARKFNYCCAYCGVRPGRLDPDHVVPLSRGGDDSPTNLLPSCADCNSSKSAMLLHEWHAWRQARCLADRATTWPLNDRRYVHLTTALLLQAA